MSGIRAEIHPDGVMVIIVQKDEVARVKAGLTDTMCEYEPNGYLTDLLTAMRTPRIVRQRRR